MMTEGGTRDIVSIVTEFWGGGGLSPIQQSLTTNQQPHTAHKQQHAPLTTAHSNQPPSLQQATASVHSVKTPLLSTPQIHTDTSRTRDGEGGDWQTDVNKHAHMAGRRTGKHTLAALYNIYTLPPTTIHSTRSHHKHPTYHSLNSGVRPGGVGCGWGSVPSAAEPTSFLSFSQTGGRVPPGSGASAPASKGWTSVPVRDGRGRSALCREAVG